MDLAPSCRVLVVDDSLTMRTTLARMLTNLGMEVVEADNGHDALARLEAGPFDIVFVDWYMPDINGLELVRRIRDRPSWAAVRLVMVTSECEGQNIASALAAGVDEYVTKPFDRQVFESKLAGIGAGPGAAA